jgi:SAM-dependent methyltransferase
MSGTTERDYVLGTHDAEIERLGLQHRVWAPRATDAWRRAGFTTGGTLVDLGCGPGWASLDLARITGPAGRVVAVDRSHRFLDALESAARREGLSWIETHELDLDESPLPVSGADGAWSRWVYAFVREPRAVLERAVAALRPGGVMVLHEYADYRAWRLSPRSVPFEAFVAEVMASWREHGGEPDIALELPGWLAELGMDVLELRPIAEVATPGSFLWRWPREFVRVGVDRLVELGRMDAAAAEQVVAELAGAERTPGAFMLTPTVLEIVARRG